MNHRSYIALLFIILLGVALRFHRISEMPLRADEAMTLFFATDLTTILHQVTTDDPHLPLYYFMLHGWLAAAGISELAERFPTLFAGVLAIPLTFVMGRTLFPRQPRAALIGAFLAALNPYMIWDAQDAYIYTFLTALTLGSFILFLRALKPDARLSTWISYIIVSLLALFFHYFAALILAAQGFLALVLVLRKRLPLRKLLHLIAAGFAIVALFTPWLILVWSVLANYRSDFLQRADLFEMAWRTLVVFTLGRADNRLMPSMIDPAIGITLASVFLALFVLGQVTREENAWDGRLVLASYLGVPLILIFGFSLARYPIFDERYVLFLAPAFLLVTALGLNALYELPKAKWMAFAAAAYVVAASAYSLFNYWYIPSFAKSPDWRGFVEKIVADSKPGDVLIQNYPDPALPYYLKEHVPRVLLPRSSAQNAADLDADLVRLTTRYDRVWFQPAPNSTWDTDGKVANWLERHAREFRAYDFSSARLELYISAATALLEAKPIGATFDRSIQLIAFDLDQTKPLALHLYWQTSEKLERDYTVFVHLYSGDGKLIAQKDGTPVNGMFPTTQWGPNETIVDSYEIVIPRDVPGGAYTLMAGMYDSQTQVRLPVVDNLGKPAPDDRVLLATVNVVSGIPTYPQPLPKGRGELRSSSVPPSSSGKGVRGLGWYQLNKTIQVDLEKARMWIFADEEISAKAMAHAP